MSTPKEELIGNSGLPVQAGQSLVEILVALAIFSLVISAVTLVFFGGQNFVSKSLESRQGLQKAHDGMEALRFIRDTNWNMLTNGIHGMSFLDSGQWVLTGSPDVSDGFTRTVSISTDTDSIKHIQLTVTWPHPPEGTQTIRLDQTLAPQDQALSGDWTQPCILSAIDGSSGAKGSDVFYANQKAYVASSATAVGKEDLYIFDVSNPKIPALLGSLNVKNGWKSLTVAGNYVYGIEENSPDFYVIDVSNPAAPVQKAKLTLTGGSGRYVMARGNYVYATTANNASGPEFFVIDVSNPLVPVVVASKEFGADINEVNVLQNTAYLATSNDAKELIAIDVTTPTNPTEIGSYNAPGTADGHSVYAKSKTRVYLGRNQSSDKELLILDASNPAAINLRGSKDVSSDVYSLITAGTLSFLGTSDTNEEFQDFFIRDPANITKDGGFNLSNIGSGADYYNNIVYMSVRNVDILQLITSMQNGICGG